LVLPVGQDCRLRRRLSPPSDAGDAAGHPGKPGPAKPVAGDKPLHEKGLSLVELPKLSFIQGFS
jgi:hypothetical protein